MVFWSRQRAQRDRQERQRQVLKALQFMEQRKGLNIKKGHRRYLLTEAPGRVIGIDRERIAQDERWDGYSGIQCSLRTSSMHILNYGISLA